MVALPLISNFMRLLLRAPCTAGGYERSQGASRTGAARSRIDVGSGDPLQVLGSAANARCFTSGIAWANHLASESACVFMCVGAHKCASACVALAYGRTGIDRAFLAPARDLAREVSHRRARLLTAAAHSVLGSQQLLLVERCLRAFGPMRLGRVCECVRECVDVLSAVRRTSAPCARHAQSRVARIASACSACGSARGTRCYGWAVGRGGKIVMGALRCHGRWVGVESCHVGR